MKVFTTGQVAKICKVAPRTVSKWFDSGRLKGYRIPGSQDRRIPREYLIKFLKEHGMPLGDLEDEAMAKVLLVGQDQVLIENLKRELPRLAEIVTKVATVHGQNHPELNDVRYTFQVLRAELEEHMMKEERVLFPYLRDLERHHHGQEPHHDPVRAARDEREVQPEVRLGEERPAHHVLRRVRP